MAANHSINFISGDQPDFLPLPLVKDHLKIDGDHENDYLESLRDAAIMAAEDYLGMFILHREVKMGFWEAQEIALVQYGPLLDPEAFQVSIRPLDGPAQDISDQFSYVEPYGATPEFRYKGDGFPALDEDPFALEFSFVAGLEKKDLPRPVIHAMLLMLAEMYEYRVDRKSINNTRARDLMRPYKVW